MTRKYITAMKKKSFVRTFLFAVTVFLNQMQPVCAQQQYMIYFDYDAQGNRIQRWWAELEQLKSVESLPFAVSDSLSGMPVLHATVYPNPTRGRLTVSLSEIPSEGVSYCLYDQRGHVLEQGKCYEAPMVLDMESYTDGLYFLLLSADRSSVSYKIVKLH